MLDSWHWFTASEGEAEILSITGRDIIAVDLNDAQKGVPLDYLSDNQRELPATTGAIDGGLFGWGACPDRLRRARCAPNPSTRR